MSEPHFFGCGSVVNTSTHSYSILLGYLDVVLLGYARVFGTQGMAAFFARTDRGTLRF